MADDVKQLAEAYNTILERIASSVEERKDLGAKLNFTVQRKNAGLKDVYSYQGPDLETVATISKYQALWTAYPQCFFPQPHISLQGISHPYALAGALCLWCGQKNAWAAMIRRACLVNFSRMEKEFNLPIENIVHLLQPLYPGTRDELIEKLKELLRRGSVLDCYIKDTSAGVIYAFGQNFTDLYASYLDMDLSNVNRWEQRIGKSGAKRKAALEHLKVIGFTSLAKNLNPMAEAIQAELYSQTMSAGVRAVQSDTDTEFPLSFTVWDASLEIFNVHAQETLSYDPCGERS